jgi:GDP-L-fucose synthase
MKILITGSSGMVGKNLLEALKDKEYQLLTPRQRDLDLLNYCDVLAYLQNHGVQFIVHCAGKVGGIQANIREPYAFLANNLLMGLNLIKAAKELKIKKLLNLSSSCCYPRAIKNPLKEEYILQGQLEPTNEGYALAKIAVLKLCAYSNPEYQYKTLIPCNLYGPWDKFDPMHSHMIPAVIKKIHEAKINNQTELEIWGDGLARREFMYAGDLAHYILKAIEEFDSLPPIMNVGLGFDYSINDYYQIVAEVLGYKGHFKYNLEKPIGMKQKLLDIELQNKLGWKAKTSLKDGIKKTYKFYLENYG